MTLPAIRDLTDRQIDELYFHPRTAQGAIEPVQEEGKRIREARTMDEELGQLDVLNGMLGGKMDNIDQAKAAVREKWQKRMTQSRN